jgi:hypothetical protein
MSARRIAGACMLGAYLLVVGFFVGIVTSAMRFDAQRAAVLSKLEDATTRVRARLMNLEHDAARSTEPRDASATSASVHLEQVRRTW